MEWKARTVLAGACAWLFIAPSVVAAQESATAEEVIQKTREAADYLAREKESGLDAFKTMKSQFAWKDDGYVFVIDCSLGKMLVNPMFKANNGKDLSKIHDYHGMFLDKPYCEAAQQPHGAWIETWHPKPGHTTAVRKLIYIRPVPGTTYQVGSGFFDETVKLGELEKLASE
jgi:signal transduction histidine kinase